MGAATPIASVPKARRESGMWPQGLRRSVWLETMFWLAVFRLVLKGQVKKEGTPRHFGKKESQWAYIMVSGFGAGWANWSGFTCMIPVASSVLPKTWSLEEKEEPNASEDGTQTGGALKGYETETHLRIDGGPSFKSRKPSQHGVQV